MPPQPVLFVHHANDMYGADIGLLHTIRSLDPGKYVPVVILPADMPTGMLSDELQRLGVEHHFAPLGILRRKYFTLRGFVPLVQDMIRGGRYVHAMVQQRKVALVYVNTFVPVAGAIGAKVAGVPVLWHVREILAVARPFRWALLKVLQRCADTVICISGAVRDSLLQEAPALADKTVVIYNAVTAAEPKTLPSDLREELGIPRDVLLVGMVGRISHWKGQEVLAAAAALVRQTFPNAHFLAVGSYFADESHYLVSLQDEIKRLNLQDRFHLSDYRTNVTEVYRALDVFVLPSTKPEPFGRVTVEAMTQGCPVIVTDHGGSRELVQQGITGFLVAPSDPQALALAIEQLLADPLLRQKIGSAAAAYAASHFGFESYARQISAVIDALAELPRAS